MSNFERGDREATLESLSLKCLTAKVVSSKIQGFNLSKTKRDKMETIVKDLTDKLLQKVSKPEQAFLHEKLQAIAVGWGLSARIAGTDKTASEYKLLVQLIPAAIVLEQ